jgi:signal transduction histidine kinase
MWESLRTRLTIIFIGLAIGPVLVVGIILAQRSFTVEQQQALTLQSQVAQRVSAEVSAFINDVENDLELIRGDLSSLENPDRAQQLSLLLSSISSGPYRDVYEELSILDADGRENLRVSRVEVVSTEDPAELAGTLVYEQPKAARENYFSPVYFDETTGEALLTIAVPLFQPRSVQLSGVLVADVRLEAVENLIAGLSLDEDQAIHIIDTDANVIARRDIHTDTAPTSYQIPGEAGRTIGQSGNDVLFASDLVPVGDQQLTVIAERTVAEALESAQNGLVISFIITAVALLIAIALVTLVVRQIVRPIEKLSEVANAIREGDLSARAAVASRDETGILARSFNEMASRQQNLIQTLEDRVAERVRDLTLATEVSSQITTELDSGNLLAEVAELTTNSFKLYHTSIFLYNEADQVIRLRQGTGNVGTQMAATGKQFHINGQGIVPLAGRTKQAALANDVQEDPSHLPNPLLPDTRAELAVPMLYRGELVGVLDLQSTEADHFTADDIRIMTTLAEQIGIAVRNAQLFEEVQTALKAAERANSVKSHFLASMSHELRTPLNAIINFTKFMLKEKMGPITERQEDALDKVKSSGIHLLNLINDVLDISKIESDSLNLLVEGDINLNQLIDRATSTAQALLENKPIELLIEVDPELPHIVGDKQRILQILLNIVSNACKFTDEGTIKLRARAEDGQVIISVEDTGPGIPAEEHETVFATFQQTNSGLRKGSGTGLGMPISRSLAQAHGGDLTLESDTGNGAIFTVTLPVHSETLELNFA